MKEIFFIFAGRNVNAQGNERKGDIYKHRKGTADQCPVYVLINTRFDDERVRLGLHSPSHQLSCDDPDRHVPLHLREG